MSKKTETKAASDGGPGLPERRAYRDMQRLGQPLAHVASFMCPVTESWCELGACRRGFCLLEKQEEANAETAYARSKSAHGKEIGRPPTVLAIGTPVWPC